MTLVPGLVWGMQGCSVRLAGGATALDKVSFLTAFITQCEVNIRSHVDFVGLSCSCRVFTRRC